MGRKSRSKKVGRTRIRKRPDEVISHGPLRIERYGRLIRFSNDSTPEQHADFLERAKETNKQVLVDLERELALLQRQIQKYEPVELMHRAAYVLMPLFLNSRSESEFQTELSYFLPTVEYLQYLIARTEPNADGKRPSEAEWEEIWGQALRVMHLTQSHLLARGTRTNPPTGIDYLRFMLDSRRLMMRVKRYPLFLAGHLRSSLAPYEQQIREIYGVSVEEIIDGIRKIDEYQKIGVLGRYRDFRETEGLIAQELKAKGYSPGPGATPEDAKRTSDALESDEFRGLSKEFQERARLAFTPAIFEITDLTSLPKGFLSLLSVIPGDSILKTLTGPDHDDLSPLSTSVLHHKPFLEVDGKFYTFYHSGFEDHIADIIEADLFCKRPAQVSEMAKRRSDVLESDADALLSSIIGPDFAHRNAYYPNPDDVGNLTELDLLLGVDDILFLVEAKAGGLSAAASRGAPESMSKGFSDLIIEGQRQSERAEKYIKSSDEVSFFDSTGRREVQRIRHSRFRKIIRIVITREDLGWVGARIAVLSILDPTLSNSYPWHVSIDDLRIIAELFRDDEIRFVHYLEQRLLASAETTLSQHDEIEHVALYNKLNCYHELPAQGMDRLSFGPEYLREIDRYFMGRSAGDTPLVPTQKMPPKMRELVSALRAARLPHRFEAGSVVLSMDAYSREEFARGLAVLDEARDQGKLRTVRLALTARKLGLTATYADGPHWEEELRRSTVQMGQGNCDRWIVIQLANKPSCEVSRIEVLTPGRFTDSELECEIARHETRAQEEIAKERPGRNDRCPCGSGRKFKKCHGFH